MQRVQYILLIFILSCFSLEAQKRFPVRKDNIGVGRRRVRARIDQFPLALQQDFLLHNWNNIKKWQRTHGYTTFLKTFLTTFSLKGKNSILRGFTVSPEVISEILNMAPVQITSEQILLIGKISKLALKANYSIKSILHLIKTRSHFKNKKEVDTIKLITFLYGANRMKEIEVIFPDIEKVKKLNNAILINIFINHISKKKSPFVVIDFYKWLIINNKLPKREIALYPQRERKLLQKLSPEEVVTWILSRYPKKSAMQKQYILAFYHDALKTSVTSPTKKKENLCWIKRFTDTILSRKDLKTLHTIISPLFVSIWIKETLPIESKKIRRRKSRFDLSSRSSRNPYYRRRLPSVKPKILEESVLLQYMPSKFCLKHVTLSLQHEFKFRACRLYKDDPLKALSVIEDILSLHPEKSYNVMKYVITQWLSPNQSRNRRYSRNYYQSRRYGNTIPLTRAKQVKKLKVFRTLFLKLKQQNITFDEVAFVSAFEKCHSTSEVYKQKDLEFFFKIENIPYKIAISLIKNMNEKLGKNWRTHKTQKENKTGRTIQEMYSEVFKGYTLCLDILQNLEKRFQTKWEIPLLYAVTLFERCELEKFANKDLKDYIKKRDTVFLYLRKATSIYSSQVPQLEKKDYSIETFKMWLHIVMGATSLSKISSPARPRRSYLEDIGKALDILPPKASEYHKKSLGEYFSKSFTVLPAHSKARFIEAGIAILKKHPSIKTFHKYMKFYKELLSEISFHAELDGESSVGYKKNFGVFLSLRHTKELGREGGDFFKYIQNIGRRSRVRNNYRDNLEKSIMEVYGEHFHVDGIVFMGENKTRSFNKTGWIETPLAYVILKSKEISVDKIPSVQIDLDFYDGKGQVVLPILSNVILIDSKNYTYKSLQNLKITQTLDARKIDRRLVTLEIELQGNRCIPDISDITSFSSLPFTVVKKEGGALSIPTMTVKDNEYILPSSRIYTIQLKPKKAEVGSYTFIFPQFTKGNVILKKYIDADIYPAKSPLILETSTKDFINYWKLTFISLMILFIGGVGSYYIRKMLTQQKEIKEDDISYPTTITPFTVLGYLSEISQSNLVPKGKRKKLTKDIKNLEEYYFSAKNKRKIKLEKIAHDWRKEIGGREI